MECSTEVAWSPELAVGPVGRAMDLEGCHQFGGLSSSIGQVRSVSLCPPIPTVNIFHCTRSQGRGRPKLMKGMGHGGLINIHQ